MAGARVLVTPYLRLDGARRGERVLVITVVHFINPLHSRCVYVCVMTVNITPEKGLLVCR